MIAQNEVNVQEGLANKTDDRTVSSHSLNHIVQGRPTN